MAQVRYLKIEVTLNELSKQVVQVPEWEGPILEAARGDNIQVIEGGETTVERDLPDPRDEFQRLANRYGPRFEDTPYVAAVYGNFGPGVSALADSIAKAARPIAPVVEAPGLAGSAPGSEGGDPDSDDNDFASLMGDNDNPAPVILA